MNKLGARPSLSIETPRKRRNTSSTIRHILHDLPLSLHGRCTAENNPIVRTNVTYSCLPRITAPSAACIPRHKVPETSNQVKHSAAIVFTNATEIADGQPAFRV